MTYLSDFRDYLSKRTDAPPEFHTFAGLASLAVAMGVRCWVDGAADMVFPNLHCVILAPSGMGKSVPLNMATNILRKAGLGDRLMPDSFSQEAILGRLEGDNNIGWWPIQEFAAFQALLGRDYNSGAQETLTALYDVPETYTRTLVTRKYVLKRPCITILGASSPDWFAAAFKGTALRGGWLARFLFCPSRAAGPPIGDPGPRDEGIEAGLTWHLRQIGELHGRFDMSAGQDLYDAFSRSSRLSARESSDFGGMRSRAPIMAQKVAMLFHVSRDPTTTRLTRQDMQQAITFVERTLASAEDYLTNEVAHDVKDGQRLRILDIVRSKGGWCPWSLALKNAHMDAQEFQRAIETLKQNGTLDVEQDGRSRALRIRNSHANSQRIGESAYLGSNGTTGAGVVNFANFRETK